MLPCLCWCRRCTKAAVLHADSPYTHGPTSSVRTGSGPPLAAPAAEGLLLGDFMGVPSRAGPAAQCASERDCCWLQLLGARAAQQMQAACAAGGAQHQHLSLLLFALHSGHSPGRRRMTKHTCSKVLRRLLLCAVCAADRWPQVRHTHLRICLLAAGCWAAQSPGRTFAPRGPCTPTPPASACLPPAHMQTPPRPSVSQGAALTLGRCPGHQRHLHK